MALHGQTGTGTHYVLMAEAATRYVPENGKLQLRGGLVPTPEQRSESGPTCPASRCLCVACVCDLLRD